MNEHDGHLMLVARCKALEQIALNYMSLHHCETGTFTVTPQEHKKNLEKQVERIAPGCSHTQK